MEPGIRLPDPQRFSGYMNLSTGQPIAAIDQVMFADQQDRIAELELALKTANASLERAIATIEKWRQIAHDRLVAAQPKPPVPSPTGLTADALRLSTWAR